MSLLYSILHRQLVCNQPRKEIPLDFALDSFACHRVDEHLVRGRESGIEVPPFACSFSKNNLEGHLCAVADEDGSVQLLDTKKYGPKAIVKEWTAHSNAIFDVAWMEGQPKLVTASGDQTARLWDLHRDDQLAMFKGHSCSLKSVNFRENDIFTFATGARDGNIMVWDIRCNRRSEYYQPVNTIHSAHTQQSATPQRVRKRSRSTRRNSVPQPVADSQQSVTAVIFHGDHTLISAGAMDGNIKMWDLRKNHTTARQGPIPYHVFPYPGNGPRKHGFSSLCLDSTQSKLYASCTNDNIYMYECSVLNEDPVCSFSGHSNSTFYVKAVLSPDDAFLLSGSSNNDAYIWKVAEPDKPPVLLKGHSGEVTSVAWCPTDQAKIITCSDDNNVRIWRMNRHNKCRDKSEFIGYSKKLPSKPHTRSQQSQTQAAGIQSPTKAIKTVNSPITKHPASTLPSKLHTNPRLNPLSSPVAKVKSKGCNPPPRKLTIKCGCPSPQRQVGRSPLRKSVAERNQLACCPASPIAINHVATCPLSPGPSSPRCQSPQQLLRSWLKVTPPRKTRSKENSIKQESCLPSTSDELKSGGLRTPVSRLRKGLGKAMSECAMEENKHETIEGKDHEMVPTKEDSCSKSPSLSPARKRQCIIGPSNYSLTINNNIPQLEKPQEQQDYNINTVENSNKENDNSHDNMVLGNDSKGNDHAVCSLNQSLNWLTTWSLIQKKKHCHTDTNDMNVDSSLEQMNNSPTKLRSDGDEEETFTVIRSDESILRYFKPSLSPIPEHIR